MKVTTREVEDVAIFDIEGDFVRLKTSGSTLHQLVKVQLDKKKKVLLNLEKLRFIDSYGIGEILSIYITALKLGSKIYLACLPKKFRLVCSDPPWQSNPEVGEVYETVGAALESLKKE